MNSSKFRLTLDLHSVQSQYAIPVMVGDTNVTLLISITDGGVPFIIEDGCLAKLSIKRPTGTHLEEFCAIKNNAVIEYSFSQNENTCAVEGIHECDVTLYRADGEKVGSPWFTMVVSPKVIGMDDIVLTDSDYTAVDAMLKKEAERQIAEAERKANEDARVNAAQTLLQASTNAVESAERAETAATNAVESAERAETASNNAIANAERAETAATNAETNVKTALAEAKASGEFKGDKGDQGIQGVKGEKGDPFAVAKVFSSIDEMNNGYATDGVQVGSFVVIESSVEDEDNAKLYIKGTASYEFLCDLSGAQGIKGEQGIQGETGKSSYQHAQEGGYLGTEEEFATKLATDFIDWFGLGVSIPEGADLNTYKTNGKYYANSESRAQTLLNRPNGMNTNFVMWVFTRTTSAIKSQLLLTLSGKMYIRSSSSSAWREWVAYTTSKEIDEVMELAKEELRTAFSPNFANDISECTDTSKMYVLPDGYLYAYMKKYVPAYTNLANPSSADWQSGYRLNSSGVATAYTGTHLTNFIPCQSGDVVRVKGLNLMEATGGYVCGYNADGTKVTDSIKLATYPASVTQVSEYEYEFTIWKQGTYDPMEKEGLTQIRFSGALESTADAVIITVNEEISDATVEAYEWANTGHTFIPSDNESRIVALEEASTAHTEDIQALQEDVANLQSGSTSDGVPDYWQDAVDEAITKVKALQDAGGKDVVSFVWFSDMHYGVNNDYVKNIGVLCKAVMDACNIPLALMNGDTLTSAVRATDTDVLNDLDGAMDILAPIKDKLMLVRGNHDDVYGWYHPSGSYDASTSVAYVNKVAPEKMWNRLHRFQASDFRRVFGGDGTYFYIDNIPQKTRFICLNSHYYDGEAITDGTVKAMTTGFGEEQSAWFREVATADVGDMDIVVCTHVPLNASDYRNQHSDWGAVYSEISFEDEYDVIAIFSGHAHRDAIYIDETSEYSHYTPNLVITCATNSSYDSSEPTRILGTDTETAIDIVTINKKTRTINTTRLGVGSDRVTEY